MDLGEKIRQLDEQVASAVRRALDDVRNELRSGLDQAIDDLRGKLAEVSPELPETFFTEEALRQLAEETAPPTGDALAAAKVEGEAVGRNALGSDLREALVAVDRARSQNDVLQALVNESSRFASRAAVLLLRPEGLVGWVAHGFEGEPEAIRSASVAAQAEDWSTAVAGEGPRRLAASRCAQLLSQLDSPLPAEGVAIPVLLRDRVSAVFYADRGTSSDRFDVAALQVLVYSTALALETLAFRQREATATLEAVVGEAAPTAEPEAVAAAAESLFEEERAGLAEEAPAALEEEPAALEEAPAAVEEAPAAVEEAPAALEEEPAAVEQEPGATIAAEELEVEGLEVEGLELGPPEAEAPPPEEEEPEVIELPEDVGEMVLETEEDQTTPWRAWKPPAAEAEAEAEAAPEIEAEAEEGPGLEAVELEPETAAEEAVPPMEPPAEIEIGAALEIEAEAAAEEVELVETELEAPGAGPAPPPAEAAFEEVVPPEASAGAETRMIAGFERDFELTTPEQAAAPAAGEVELEIEELELDAEVLEELPELEPGPVAPTAEPVLELEEELPEAAEAGGMPIAEAVEPAEPEPPAPAPAEPAAPVEAEHPAEVQAAAPVEESPAAESVPEAPATTTSGAFAGAVPEQPSGGPIEPPTDIQGPGLAFSDKGAAGGASGDDAAHQEARRLARLLVSEIQLYNQDDVEEGRRNGDIYERLKDDIDRSRQLYEERVAPDLRESTDYFYQELVRQLGAGDAKALGI